MSGVDEALLEAVRLRPDADVLVLGGEALALGAQERVTEGWVYVVRSEVDDLEELLGQAHARGATGVAYLVGETPVLPLPDAAVAAALGRLAPGEGSVAAAAPELARVLAPGGWVALASPAGEAAAEVVAALGAAGFDPVEVVELDGEAVVSGRRA
jgi:SAM-dependent methyltransferase